MFIRLVLVENKRTQTLTQRFQIGLKDLKYKNKNQFRNKYDFKYIYINVNKSDVKKLRGQGTDTK